MTVVKINSKKHKKCVINRKIKFENCKNCLEATQLENKINYQEKNEINVDIFKEDHKGFIKNNKLILNTQQRFKSESHAAFTEKINKIGSSSWW